MNEKTPNNNIISVIASLGKRGICFLDKWDSHISYDNIILMTTYFISFVISGMSLWILNRIIQEGAINLNQHAIIALGFPFLFLIPNKALKGSCITLCSLVVLMRLAWLGLVGIGITFLIMTWKNSKFLFVILLTALIIFAMLGGNFYSGWNFSLSNPFLDARSRLEYYGYAMCKWAHIWNGEGYHWWYNLPELQASNQPTGKHLHVVHSDLVQGFVELGVLKMTPILILILLPLAFLKLYTPLHLATFLAYLNLLFQGCLDFPFHRFMTGTLGIVIIIMMYVINWRQDEILHRV